MDINAIVDRIEAAEKAGEVATINVYYGVMSPISRHLWVQLPIDVRYVLENEFDYTHYDVTTDSITTKQTIIRDESFS